MLRDIGVGVSGSQISLRSMSPVIPRLFSSLMVTFPTLCYTDNTIDRLIKTSIFFSFSTFQLFNAPFL